MKYKIKKAEKLDIKDFEKFLDKKIIIDEIFSDNEYAYEENKKYEGLVGTVNEIKQNPEGWISLRGTWGDLSLILKTENECDKFHIASKEELDNVIFSRFEVRLNNGDLIIYKNSRDVDDLNKNNIEYIKEGKFKNLNAPLELSSKFVYESDKFKLEKEEILAENNNVDNIFTRDYYEFDRYESSED